MTQVKYMANPQQRLARVLSNLEGRNYIKWEPSREEMLAMRQCSRAGYSLSEAYEHIKPGCSKEVFRRRAKAIGVKWGQTSYSIEYQKQQGK